MEIGVNTSNQPWIEIGALLVGSLGCNQFGEVTEDPYSFDKGMLAPGEVVRTASLCLFDGDPDSVEAMEVEEAFYGIFYPEGIDGIQVDVDDDEMVWTAANTTLTFSKAEAPPASG